MASLTRVCPHCRMPNSLDVHCTPEQRTNSCSWLRCSDCGATIRPTKGYGNVTRNRATVHFQFPPLHGDGTPVLQEPDQA